MTLTATVEYPYEDRERAALALRGKLRADAGRRVVDWSSFELTGPREFAGQHGRSWFEWIATVRTSPSG